MSDDLAKTTMAESDSLHSSRREKLVEHSFVAEVLRALWCKGIHEVDVLRSETDASGYDIVLQVGATIRHIQLKSSSRTAKTAKQNINMSLGKMQSGCVVWVLFEQATMDIGPFLWFGESPGERLPDITTFPVAKHSKANSKGEKTEKKNLRVIKKRQFTQLTSISEVIERLFGEVQNQ